MTAPVFVDTNVLLYAVDVSDAEKQKSAREWRAFLWSTRRGRISFQVIQEFYVNALRIRPSGLDETRAEVRDLVGWNPVVVDSQIVETAWKLQDRYQLSFWDALIVSAAKAAGCGYLLTEDLQARQVLDEVVVVNPFLSAPESLP
jgi:predicted nucleic acid-binding protein